MTKSSVTSLQITILAFFSVSFYFNRHIIMLNTCVLTFLVMSVHQN